MYQMFEKYERNRNDKACGTGAVGMLEILKGSGYSTN